VTQTGILISLAMLLTIRLIKMKEYVVI